MRVENVRHLAADRLGIPLREMERDDYDK